MRRFHIGSEIFLYPWEEEAGLRTQLRDMLETGLTLARIFIPWSDIEPEEELRDFSTYDRFFRLCEELGMQITATLGCLGVPAWFERELQGRFLTGQEEETLAQRRIQHVREVVGRYADSPALHSWILANEPRLTLPHSAANLMAFRRYLRDIHPRPEDLRRRYGVRDVEDVGYVGEGGAAVLPIGKWSFAPKVDWANFTAGTLCARLTAINQAVKETDPHHPTTLNPDGITEAMPTAEGRHFWKLAGCVDFLGLSCHVSWHSTRFSPRKIHQSVGLFCDMVRSATKDPQQLFHVTELQAGTNYFSGTRPMCPTPGDLTAWLWESLGAGAKGIVYWLINARSSGFEGLEWGLNNQAFAPSRRSRASRAVYEMLLPCRDLLEAARAPRPSHYILHSMDSMTLASIEADIAGGATDKGDPRNRFLIADALCGAYTLLWDAGRTAGFVEGEGIEALRDSDVLIVPNAYALPLETVRRIVDFVKRGGQLIVDGLFAAKDPYGDTHFAARPLLTELFGGILEDFGVSAAPFSLTGKDTSLEGFYLQGWFEEGEGREVLLRHGDGTPAAIACTCGKGKAVYIGTQFFERYFAVEGEDPLACQWLDRLLRKAAGPRLQNPGAMTHLRILESQGQTLLLLSNREEARDVRIRGLTGGLEDLLSGEVFAQGRLPMDIDQVRLLRLREA